MIALRVPGAAAQSCAGSRRWSSSPRSGAWPWLVPPIPATRPLAAPPAGTPAPALAAPPPARQLRGDRRAAAVRAVAPAAARRRHRVRLVDRERATGCSESSPAGEKRPLSPKGRAASRSPRGDKLDGWTVSRDWRGSRRARFAGRRRGAPAETRSPGSPNPGGAETSVTDGEGLGLGDEAVQRQTLVRR